MPKVSILIPVYNVEKYLSDCLDSVINQTMQDIEIICVNDGSTDHSLKILEEYASKDPRIKVISQENKGTLIARKIACQHATGEYCLFLDSDDWLELNACKELYDAIKKYDVEILQYKTIVESISVNPNLESKVQNTKSVEILNNSFIQYQYITGIQASSYIIKHHGSLGTSGKLIKTTLLKEVLSLIEDVFMIYFEDPYLNLIIFHSAKSYYGINESYYHYRIGVGISGNIVDISWDKFLKKQKSLYNCYNCIKHFCSSHNYNYNQIYSFGIQNLFLKIQNASIIWSNNIFPNSQAFDFVIDTWDIVQLLSQLDKSYNTLEKQVEFAQSLHGSQKLAHKPFHQIHTIGIFVKNFDNDNYKKDILHATTYWLQLGYKVIIFTEEVIKNEHSYAQEIIKITLSKNFSNRLEILQYSIKKYHIDIMIHSDSNNLFWDLCLCKYYNIPFVACQTCMGENENTYLIPPFITYCDAILSPSYCEQLLYSTYTQSVLLPQALFTPMPEDNTSSNNTTQNDTKEQWHQVFLSLENQKNISESTEDTKKLINTFSEYYFNILQERNTLKRELSITKKKFQALQTFCNIPASGVLATALVSFYSHFSFLFRIFSFIIRRFYSIFFSLKNYGLKTTISKIYKFVLKKLKLEPFILKIVSKQCLFKRKLILLVDNTFNDSVELTDNFSLFEYLQSKPEYQNISYYLINIHNVQYPQIIAKYPNKIIPVEHGKILNWLLFKKLMIAKYWLDSFQVLSSFDPNAIISRGKITTVYTQHGINYFKLGFLGDITISPKYFNKIVVSNENEQKLLKKYYGYDDQNVVMAGLSRYDLIKEESKEKIIFVYFTLRAYLVFNQEMCYESRYLKNIINLLSSEVLKDFLEKHNIKIYFAIHHQMRRNDSICQKLSHINLIEDKDIGMIKQKASMLITDFSSICFDFMIKDKPVIFFHVDAGDELCKLHPDSYENDINVESKNDELYNVFYKVDDVIDATKRYVENNFMLEDNYKKINDKFFTYRENIREHLIQHLLSSPLNIDNVLPIE